MIDPTSSTDNLVPGTEVLLDFDNSTSHDESELILIPEPSNDPRDPLVRNVLNTSPILN
jgi:hypothetical protein